MKNRFALLSVVGALSVLTGCATGGASGIGGTEKFACSAPDGVSCLSISGISENINNNTLESLNRKKDASSSNGAVLAQGKSGSTSSVLQALPRSYMTPVDELNAPKVGQSVNIAGNVVPNRSSVPNSGTPLRSPEQVLRIWIAPFEDTEGDLHDQKYIYLAVNTGQWQLDAIRGNAKKQPFENVRVVGGSPKDAPNLQQRSQINPNEAAQDVVRGNLNRQQ